ncbi:MAG: hypothetical protein ACXWB9_05355 [Flavisolibacter sp.]
MKNNFLVFMLMGLVAFSSCKKTEVATPQDEFENPATTTTGDVKLSAWQQPATWNSNTSNGSVEASLSDNAISAEVVNEGMVLVYAQQGNDRSAMPFQANNASWFYQVSEGNIAIYGNGAAGSENEMSFSYVVLSKDQVSTLESNGTSKSDLLNLSFEQAKQLF